jgi:hypothetical protein
MTHQDSLYGVDIIYPLPQTAIAADTLINGDAIELKRANCYKLFLQVSAYVAGSVEIQDIQFDTVNTFDSANLKTVDNSGVIKFLLPNDNTLEEDALLQTKLEGVGTKSIRFPAGIVTSEYKFFRVRALPAGGADLTAQVVGVYENADKPIISE